MKVFVVLAVLVAAAAAQSFDYKYNTNKQLLKELIREKELVNGMDLVGEKKFGGIRDMYTREGIDMPINERINRIFTIEEMYNTELFQEYMNIPLFRQFFHQVPVFKHYVASPLFQNFWAHPLFKQYFKNPVLFYKYIVPQVHIYREVTDVNTDVFDRDVLDKVNYGTTMEDNMMMTPFVGKYHHNNMFNKYNMLNKYNLYKNTPIKHILEQLVRKNMFPLMEVENLEGIRGIELPTTMYDNVYPTMNMNNMDVETELIKYKYILDKIYKHLYVNKPVTEVMTDVKIVKEPTKIIDETEILPESRMLDTVVRGDMKDMLLKKLLLNKIRYGKLVGETETPREMLKELELEQYTPSMYKTIGNEWTTPYNTYKHMYGGRTFEKYPTIQY